MTMNLKDELLLVTTSLGEVGIDYALCGGMAVVIHGYPRATRDIDLLIRQEDLDRARKSLASCGYDFEAGIISFDTDLPTERRVFRVTKVEGREDHLVAGRTLRVVSKLGLAKMKRVAGRPQDLADLSQLGLEETGNESGRG
jgi:hypothetical protein